MDTWIKTRVLTACCCAGSGEGVMEDIKRDKGTHNINGHMHKTIVLTSCCCAGSGKEGTTEDAKRDKCVYEVDRHTHKMTRNKVQNPRYYTNVHVWKLPTDLAL